MKFAPRGIAVAALVSATTASAALTVSEQAQVRQLVATADLQSASRVRAMIARTDLTTEETIASLRDAMTPVAFDPVHVAFTRELAFGGPSQGGRAVLSIATVRAVLARADALLSRHASDLDTVPSVLAELERIYAFIGADVANAGHPGGAAHDPATGIPASSYDECAKALADHIERNPRWLKGDARLAPPATKLRAQAQLALFELLNDVPTRRADAADRLGIAGPRRALLVDHGLLVLDDGKADSARVERLRALLDRLPPVRVGVEAIYFGDDHPGLRARGTVLATKTPLEAVSAPDTRSLFPDDVEPGTRDAALSELAHALASVAAQRALDSRADLRAAAERDVRAAGVDSRDLLGRKAESGAEDALADAVEMLVTDAPRTVDLAFVRFLSGRPHSVALLSDALGVLAAFAPPGAAPASGLTLALGKPKGQDGSTEHVFATAVRLLPSGGVTSFTLEGHVWTLSRADALGPFTAVRRDGADVALAMLPSARLPATAATSWSVGGLLLAKMQGAPRAGVAVGPRIRLVGTGEKGFDAIATPAPADDLVVEADLAVQGDAAGIAVRAASGTSSFRGAALVLRPGPSPQIALLQKEESGFESYLAAPVDLAALPATVHARVTIRGRSRPWSAMPH